MEYCYRCVQAGQRFAHQHDICSCLHHLRIFAADPVQQHGQARVDAAVAKQLWFMHRKNAQDAVQKSQPAKIWSAVVPGTRQQEEETRMWMANQGRMLGVG